MVSRTSGGLIKRSMSFGEEQLRDMELQASERNTSTAAVMRELIDLGREVQREMKKAVTPVKEMAVKLAANQRKDGEEAA